MKKILIGLLVVLIIGIGVFYFSGNQTVTGNVVKENLGSDNVKTFVLTSSHLRFFLNGVESPELKVKLGDKVKIILNNEEGFHDWAIDAFGAATERVNADKSTSVEFVADKKGTFEYYCSVGQHREKGMFGKFVVE